jgi:hypothetical protein
MKYINNIKPLLCGTLLLVAGSTFTSCTDWLDKDPESIVAEDEAFKNYRNFQGYIEEIYDCIPDVQKVNYCTSWNWGDDAVHNPEGYAHMDHQVDLGNYRNIWSNSQQFINGSGSNGSWDAKYSLWKASWYCIRKCNMGIENIKSLVGTDEERDLLLGQMYFFRAWWHFELMTFFGGLPYIDKAFEASEIPELPRLSFQECADRCAEDFKQAYNLLPMDWDATLAGMQTSGSNQLRVNKFMALCYLGKCYLWAGSPLMKEFEKTKNGGVAQLLGASSNGKTYDYDEEYVKKAAQALGQALDMVDKGTVPYKLAEYKYDNIYDHVMSDKADEDNYYYNIFYTTKKNWGMPGAKEAIFRGVCPPVNSAPWNCAKLFGPKVSGLVEHDNIIHHPTANLVDQYGMANGQPIYLVKNGVLVLNPNSGWDPEHPYLNRDPRFYHDIIFDGFHYVTETGISNLNDEQKKLEYCDLYTGGAMRSVDNASSTGYFIQKLVPHQCNIGDKWYDWDYALQTYIPYMRLADVYLMYAEARAAIACANNNTNDFKEKPNYCPALSAVDAINALRDRVNSMDYPMEHVPAQFLADTKSFMDEVRRERTVELSFEGFRWNDLQRWLLLTEPPYIVKYSHEFERLEWGEYKEGLENEKDEKKRRYTWDWFKTHDPKDAKVANFHRKDLITRRLDSKHYWFPLPDKDTYLYEGFKQNPGW